MDGWTDWLDALGGWMDLVNALNRQMNGWMDECIFIMLTSMEINLLN